MFYFLGRTLHTLLAHDFELLLTPFVSKFINYLMRINRLIILGFSYVHYFRTFKDRYVYPSTVGQVGLKRYHKEHLILEQLYYYS